MEFAQALLSQAAKDWMDMKAHENAVFAALMVAVCEGAPADLVLMMGAGLAYLMMIGFNVHGAETDSWGGSRECECWRVGQRSKTCFALAEGAHQ